ncbi:hypothetical protein CRE_09399 [Caenorhabditis remanei]|uniref:Uncharacterized protein n=1 Tax=Caenorhabditis remanei TaxID=31234 RepID=E3LIM8_CAERE|nr:hypothetical protein CRE_09399 [Caenorhabditis remanei]
MGQRGSRTAPEHVERVEEDRHSAWGSDIDDTFCGPGKICADDWTPMHSLAATPESQRRRFSEAVIIREQPGISEKFDDDNVTNFDVMTIHEDFDAPPILVAPVVVRPRRRKKTKLRRNAGVKRKIKSRRKSRSTINTTVETPVLRSYSRPQYSAKLRKHRPRHHMIYVRRIRIHQDPRYPKIPRPSYNQNLKFRRGETDETNRFSKAVPPSHLKGQPISARPHFRYRGIPKIII